MSSEREGLAPHPDLLRHLAAASRALGLQQAEMRILDWGCGTGVAVEALRTAGWDVYGADIDERAVLEGNDLIGGERLVLADDSGKTPFPSGCFNFVYSQAVFEHVRDPKAAVREIRRLTTKGGMGFHILPAPFMPLEPHISMPFVHWLPKNDLRRVWVRACCRLGLGLSSDVNQRAVRGMSLDQKVAFECAYLNNHTFYRQFWQLGRVFRKAGFEVDFPVLSHHRLARFGPILSLPAVDRLAQLFLLSCVAIHIKTLVRGRP